jgi:LPXTG-motif cell wall-anchored protein
MLARNGVLIAGVVLILAGGTFFLQGIGVLPGSYMTGQMFWAWAGLLLLALGGGVVFFGRRGRRVP